MAEKKVTEIFKSRQSQDRTGDLVVGRQRSYQLQQPCPPRKMKKTRKKENEQDMEINDGGKKRPSNKCVPSRKNQSFSSASHYRNQRKERRIINT